MNYSTIYTGEFFDTADGIAEWQRGQLKFGDACAAIGYALGLPSFAAVQEALGFTGVGRGDVPAMPADEQLGRLVARQTRVPRSILEIGCGRGEVASAFAHMGYPVQAIEPSPGASHWMGRTCKQFWNESVPSHLRLVCAPLHEAVVDWGMVDTVVLVESLEHILAEDFEPMRRKIVEVLKAWGGRLIITNWLDYHPIEVGWYAAPDVHCRVVDDALYDAWSKEAKTVVVREGSHLVLDF